MNRSQRRAAVVRRSIAAGLLCVGFGTTLAGPALADRGDETGGAVASNIGRVGRGGSVVPAGTDDSAGSHTRRGTRIEAEPTDGGWHPRPDWCHFVWLPWPIDPPLPYNGSRNGLIAQFLPTQAAVAVAGGIADGGAHASTAFTDAPPEAVAAPAPAAGPAAAPPDLAPIAVALPAAAPRPPALAPADRPGSVVPAPNRAPAGLPHLPSANLGQIAAVALPGLAGIAALTALGGFLGYRQAKAGYVLRAAGTARFLQ